MCDGWVWPQALKSFSGLGKQRLAVEATHKTKKQKKTVQHIAVEVHLLHIVASQVCIENEISRFAITLYLC